MPNLHREILSFLMSVLYLCRVYCAGEKKEAQGIPVKFLLPAKFDFIKEKKKRLGLVVEIQSPFELL